MSDNDATFEYAAFISYRHTEHDKKVARLVQKAIETYKIPRNVARERVKNRSQIVGRAFLDETELEASPSLAYKINEALLKSEYLIVICSPDACKSPWIAYEVESFIKLRERDRVIAVLADGEMNTALPKVLLDVYADDRKQECEASRSVPLNGHAPLAADLRKGTGKNRNDELLRIIAALLDTAYDDLRQRETSRKRKNIRLIAGACIVLAALIASLGIIYLDKMDSAAEKTASTHAEKLLVQSKAQLAEGDRIGAIRSSLDALDSLRSSKESEDLMPAQQALEDALQTNSDKKEFWLPCFSYRSYDVIQDFALSPTGAWIAILESDATVTFRDITTGRKISSCKLPYGEAPEDLEPRNWKIKQAGSKLVACSHAGTGYVACIDADSGTIDWSLDGPKVDAFAVSDDEKTIDFMVADGFDLFLVELDVETEKLINAQQLDNPGIQDSGTFLPCSMGTYAHEFYVGCGPELLFFNLADGTMKYGPIERGVVASIHPVENDVVVAAWDIRELDSPVINDYWFCRYTKEIEKVWVAEGEWIPETNGKIDKKFNALKLPEIHEVMHFNGCRTLACTVGNTMQLLDTETGSVLYSEKTPTTIIGFNSTHTLEPNDIVYTFSADGRITLISPTYASSVGSLADAQLPILPDRSLMDVSAGNSVFVVGRDGTDPTKLMVYRNDIASQEKKDYSLEELIDMGHQIVDNWE